MVCQQPPIPSRFQVRTIRIRTVDTLGHADQNMEKTFLNCLANPTCRFYGIGLPYQLLPNLVGRNRQLLMHQPRFQSEKQGGVPYAQAIFYEKFLKKLHK